MDNQRNLTIETIDGFERLSPKEMEALPVTMLYELQDALVGAAAVLEHRKKLFWGVMQARYAEVAQYRRVGDGKDTGTVHLLDSGHDIECLTSKRVEWDDAKLRDALGRLSKEEQAHYATVKLSVAEAKYTAAPPHIQKLLQPARSVKPTKETFKITAPGD